MVMNELQDENEFWEIRDKITAEIKPALRRILCPLRAGCPDYGENKPRGKKRRCYGRLFDLAETNGDAWLRFRCQRTKQVMVIRQRGSQIDYWDTAELEHDQLVKIPQKFQQIRCPICEQWILDVYQEAGEFLVEFKCPTHRNIVSWCGTSRGQRGDNEENSVCA